MADREKDNKIEQAQNRLDSRAYRAPDANQRSGFENEEETVPSRWGEPAQGSAPEHEHLGTRPAKDAPGSEVFTERESAPPPKPTAAPVSATRSPHESRDQMPEGEHRSGVSVFFNKLFLGSVIFFAVAVGAAVWLFLTGSFFVSGENVTITVEGPAFVASAEESTFDVIIANDNNVALTDATLTIEYPDSARDAGDLRRKKTREIASIGSVGAGEQIRATIDTVFLGQADSQAAIDLSFSYGVEDSNASFVRERRHELLITASPIDVSVSSPTEVNSSQPVTFEVTISSNANITLPDVLFAAQYPLGFSVRDTEPDASEGQNVWAIGDLEPEEERTIRITGNLNAVANEQRTFVFTTGVETEMRADTITPVLNESQRTLTINAPYLGLSARFNGRSSEEFIGEVGGTISTNVSWVNNLDERIADVELIARLGGNALLRESVSVRSDGFYRSSQNEAVWNKSTNQKLFSMDSNERVDVDFDFGSLRELLEETPTISNPHITVELEARGTQVTDANLPETISASHSVLLKMNTVMGIEGHAVYSDGPFENSGPVPPLADEPTTFTIVLNAFNRYNDVEDASFTARLPIYVEWMGNTTDDDTLSYNSNTRQVRWDMSELPRQSGYARGPNLVAFQVRLTPSLDHVRNWPVLLRDGVVVGRDTYTGQYLEVGVDNVSTDLQFDPTYSRLDGRVESR
ncbi:MAG: hypothetical protein WDZ79_01465 [Candidatus Paceibacterota bacterium]